MTHSRFSSDMSLSARKRSAHIRSRFRFSSASALSNGHVFETFSLGYSDGQLLGLDRQKRGNCRGCAHRRTSKRHPGGAPELDRHPDPRREPGNRESCRRSDRSSAKRTNRAAHPGRGVQRAVSAEGRGDHPRRIALEALVLDSARRADNTTFVQPDYRPLEQFIWKGRGLPRVVFTFDGRNVFSMSSRLPASRAGE